MRASNYEGEVQRVGCCKRMVFFFSEKGPTVSLNLESVAMDGLKDITTQLLVMLCLSAGF